MAVINAVILPAKALTDGRHKIRISVAHNGETRYILTNIILDSTKEFRNGVIVKRADASYLNTKLRGILQKYQETIDDLEFANNLSCPELVFQIKNAGNYKRRTLQSVCEEMLTNSRALQSTLGTYNTCWNIICKYLNNKMLVENISTATILSLDKSLRMRGLKSGTIRTYMACLRTVVSYAKKCGYVQFRVDPFAGYTFPKLEVRQSWLSVEEVKAIRDIKSTKKNICKCRDMFMLSYYLGGINITDLLDINFNENTDSIKYIRKKTRNKQKLNEYVEFQIPEEAKAIIEKYKDKDGRFWVSSSQRKYRCDKYFRRNMPKLAEAIGAKEVIYYSARKSFSQHAFNLGINTGVIDYILGHSLGKGGNCLYNYIYVTPQMATDAIRKVLDNLK